MIEWIGTAAGFVGLLTGGTALGRLMVTHGGDRQRLSACEVALTTAAAKSDIDRLAGALATAVHKGDFDNLARRVDEHEGQMTEFARLLGDIRVEMGKIPEQFKSQNQMMTLQFENVNHRISGVKQVMEGMADGRLRLKPPADT